MTNEHIRTGAAAFARSQPSEKQLGDAKLRAYLHNQSGMSAVEVKKVKELCVPSTVLP